MYHFYNILSIDGHLLLDLQATSKVIFYVCLCSVRVGVCKTIQYLLNHTHTIIVSDFRRNAFIHHDN